MADLLELDVDALLPDPNQPRKTFLKEELQRLASSITARGVLMPLRVRRDQMRNAWIIVSGECRWHAARLAGRRMVPCVMIEGEPEEADILADQITENTARNSLPPVQLARALAKLKALKGWNSQELAAEIGMSGPSVSRSEALLTLPEAIQQLIDAGRVEASTAYEISRHPDEQGRLELAHAVAEGRMHRRDVIDAVQAVIGKKNVRPPASRLSCKLAGGLSLSVTAGRALTWKDLFAVLDTVQQEGKKLQEGGKPIAALARLLRAS